MRAEEFGLNAVFKSPNEVIDHRFNRNPGSY